MRILLFLTGVATIVFAQALVRVDGHRARFQRTLISAMLSGNFQRPMLS
jgi:hypothetical protein